MMYIYDHAQVPLGVILKNEAKGDDMVDIMSHVHQYVPTVAHTEEVTLTTGEKVVVNRESMYPLLFGGDQMTASRARSAKKVKRNSETPSKRLEGIVPVFEDWHAKANFLGVSKK